MKHFNFWALALTAIIVASCTSEDDLTLSPPANQAEEETMAPILFTSSQSAFTRAEFTGAEAAKLLGNMFVVSGYKGSQTTWDADNNKIVYENYLVNWRQNSANTTESNSSNWEYVGITPIKHATGNGITSQTIKYWDYTQTQYDFIAWSTGTKTPVYEDATAHPTLASNEVRVTRINPATATNEAYKFEGTAEDLSQCYISDLVTVYKGNATGTAPFYNVVENGYNKPVTLKFRQLGTKVRIAIYETVPGYSVKNVQFYTAADVALADETKNDAHLFTTTPGNIYRGGTYTVKFPTVDAPTNADNNQAHITFSGTGYTQDTKVKWGTMNYTGREESEKLTTNSYLGRSSNTASFAGTAANNYYDFFLPNEAGTNLNLRVNYTLESIDGSGEEINVKGATAQVPSIYTTWKPGYAYTYLFKISDKTNGHTGIYDPEHPDDTYINSDPAGLYPITFDAIVVNAEDGNNTQETITLVSTPSITTYQNGSNVVNKNEYTVLSTSAERPEITGEIYVTVNDGTDSYVPYTPTSGDPLAGLYTESGGVYTLVTSGTYSGTGTYYKKNTPSLDASNLADLTSKAKLYTLPALPTGRTAPWSEAEVIDALQIRDDDGTSGTTIKGRSGLELTEATEITTDDALTAGQWKLTKEVTYGADGNKIDLTDGTKKKAAKFLPTATTTYAFVYTKQAATEPGTPKYQPIAFGDATVTKKYRYKLNTIASAGDVQKNTVYVKSTEGIAPVFLGQGTGNLFISSGAGYSPVNTTTTPYAVSSPSTEYYYTLDGTNYTLAKNIEYANFNATGDNQLYVKSGAYYVAKPTSENKPVDGTAYYFRTGTDPNYTYTYCVILPEQTTTSWKTVDTNNYEEVGGSEAEITGMTYFDKYIVNDGVYYVKVIKVQ